MSLQVKPITQTVMGESVTKLDSAELKHEVARARSVPVVEDHARHQLRRFDPEPSGRFGACDAKAPELVHHLHRRLEVLLDLMLPSLGEHLGVDGAHLLEHLIEREALHLLGASSACLRVAESIAWSAVSEAESEACDCPSVVIC